MFTVAAKYVIEQGGYVAGAAYEQDYKVEHIIINNIGDLWRLRGSKYMQSYAAKVYPEIKKLLKDGKMVLFTGNALSGCRFIFLFRTGVCKSLYN